MSVIIKNLVSATVNMDNSTSEGRAYDISADVTINYGAITGMSGGVVRGVADKEGSANFSASRGINLNVIYNNVESPQTQSDILSAIQLFTSEINEYLSEKELMSLMLP